MTGPKGFTDTASSFVNRDTGREFWFVTVATRFTRDDGAKIRRASHNEVVAVLIDFRAHDNPRVVHVSTRCHLSASYWFA